VAGTNILSLSKISVMLTTKPFAHGALTREIIGAAMTVHRTLGRGYLETVYQRAMEIELQERQLAFVRQRTIPLSYRGQEIGEYRLDIVVAECVVLELKAVSGLTPGDDAQLFNYLRCADAPIGLLLNFGAPSLEFKRRVLDNHR
jgi:GxxExxY protein